VNLVDWVLVGATLVFAWAGWRQGFVAGVLSFAGFLGGGLAAAFLLPRISASLTDNPAIRVGIVVVGVIIAALIGQFVTSLLGRRLHDAITWRPARLIDNAAGATLAVIALAIMAWIVASAVAFLPSLPMATQIQQSRLLVMVDTAVPNQVRDAFVGLRNMVSSADAPRVFSVLGSISGPSVALPDPAVILGGAVTDARPSVVRVSGKSNECRVSVSGSGFVYAPQHVMTNAHVVAGIASPEIQVRVSKPLLPATVVYFDPQVDIAVLYVPDLEAPAIDFAHSSAQSGDDAIIAGFPEGGPYDSAPARIRDVITARGDDIYGKSGVEREVYSFRGDVKHGNSGGPLLTTRGEALGMIFASGTDKTGYALTAEQLRVAAARGLRSDEQVETGSCRIHE
jgi:S1-C subfamily serine protease